MPRSHRKTGNSSNPPFCRFQRSSCKTPARACSCSEMTMDLAARKSSSEADRACQRATNSLVARVAPKLASADRSQFRSERSDQKAQVSRVEIKVLTAAPNHYQTTWGREAGSKKICLMKLPARNQPKLAERLRHQHWAAEESNRSKDMLASVQIAQPSVSQATFMTKARRPQKIGRKRTRFPGPLVFVRPKVPRSPKSF